MKSLTVSGINLNSKRNIKQNLSTPSNSAIIGKIFIISLIGIFFSIILVRYLAYTEHSHLPIIASHSLREIRQNLGLLQQGFSRGYLRSILGIVYFFMMSSFFVFSGKLVIAWLFKRFNDPENGLDKVSLLERLSLYYIFGALMASLLWFVLGVAGLLKSSLALIIALGGCTGLFYQFFSSERRDLSITKDKFYGFPGSLPLTDKVVSIALSIFLMLLSTRAFAPMTGDTLTVVAALPNAYINEGRLFFTPYHFYTYFTQNTEMLVMWSLLLKSEIAACLVIWGLLAALVLLILGFFGRTSSYEAGLATVFVLLSTPIVIDSIWTKPDLPTAVFLFAHYMTLIQALNTRSKPWSILSGLFCGGAIGYKLVALPAALFSFLILLGWELYGKIRSGSKVYLSIFWVLGCVLAVAPWFIRTGMETGDPVYPFLSNLFGRHISDPIYGNFTTRSFSYNTEGAKGVLEYVYPTLFKGFCGPSLLFALLGIFLFSGSHTLGLRLSIMAAFFSLLYSLHWLDIRYFLGQFIFLVCGIFGTIWKETIDSFNAMIFKRLLLSILLCCFYLEGSMLNAWYLSHSVLWNVILSGNSQENYSSDESKDADDMRWMHYIINSKCEDKGTVLYAGLYYFYGLKGRRAIFSSGYADLNREPICEIAKNSADSNALFSKIIGMGVKHLLISSSFLKDVNNQSVIGVAMTDHDIQKIRDLLQKYTDYRYITPDRKVIWLTLKTGNNPGQIYFSKDDAKNFPLDYMEEAESLFRLGNTQNAMTMMSIAIHSPISDITKCEAYDLFADMYKRLGDQDRMKKILDEKALVFPQG